jgi:glycosyltransferase involved in cell wall biosynthesis
MTLRAAILIDPSNSRIAPFWEAIEDCLVGAEIRRFCPRTDWTGQVQDREALSPPANMERVQHKSLLTTADPWLRQCGLAARLFARLPLPLMLKLVAYRPDLILCEDFGTPAMQAALFRSVSRSSCLLLCVTKPPRRFGLREQVILNWADGVFADGDEVVQAVAQLRFPVSRIFPLSTSHEIETFLACARTRSSPEAHRLAFAGDLSPRSGAADLLISLAAWAEQNPGRQIEIWWIGEGDLAGVLGAQPLPGTISQRFLGQLDPDAMAAAFGQCGLFVDPSLGHGARTPILEALAAGLPVLGSRRNPRARQFVHENVNGWLFDPLQPADILQAISRALGSSTEQLNQMRDKARNVAFPLDSRDFADRLSQAFALVMPAVVLASGPRPAVECTR